jgi:hypothetical protein
MCHVPKYEHINSSSLLRVYFYTNLSIGVYNIQEKIRAKCFIKHYAMKMHGGSVSIAPPSIDLGTS